MQNNLLNRYLLPYYVSGAMFFATGTTATVFAVKDAQLAKTHAYNPQIVANSNSTQFFCVLMIMVSLGMIGISVVYQPKFARKKVDIMAQHYLQEFFQLAPEAAKYRFVLDDPEKVRNIAALICNDLTEDEQKQILHIINDDSEDFKSSNKMTRLYRIEYKILDVIKKHAEKDPEYMNKILLAIANTQKPDITKTQQKVK